MERIRRRLGSAGLLLVAAILALAGCAVEPTPEATREVVEVTRVVERVVTATLPAAKDTPTPIPLPALSISVGSYDNVMVVGMDESLDGLVDALQSAGFTISTLQGVLTPRAMSQCGIILFCNRLYLGEGEAELLKAWIRAGGGAMFLHTRWGSAHNPSGQRWREAANAVLTPVAGIRVDDRGIRDPKNRAWGDRLFTEQIHAHPATEGVRRIIFGDDDFSVTPINPQDPQITLLVTGEEDAYNDYYPHSPPLAVAAEVASEDLPHGRVVAVGSRTALAEDIGRGDNRLFALQAVEWLAHSQ